VITKPILLIRANGNELDASALNELGIPTCIDPFLSTVPNSDQTPAFKLLDATNNAMDLTWIIATSINAITAWSEIVGAKNLKTSFSNHHLSFAAVGESTKLRLAELGADKIMVGTSMNSQSLLGSLKSTPPATAIIPGGNLTLETLPDGLETAGWKVIRGRVYENSVVNVIPSSTLKVRNDEFSAVLLRSPSAARALSHFLPKSNIPVICGGPTTAQECERLGLNIAVISPEPTSIQLALLIHKWLENQ
jgi:uroporphyrinogen-III synthase